MSSCVSLNSSGGRSSMASTCDGRNSGNSSSGTTTRTGDTEDDLHTIKDALAKQETKQLFRLRIIVVMILVAAATGISLAVFFLTRKAQVNEFESQYYGMADNIIDHFQEILKEVSAVSGLAVSATAHAESIHQLFDGKTQIPAAWPFVTLPYFQERAGNVRYLSGAIYVSINPIVTTEQLPFWESYVQSDANQWM